jgi:hypothetical protein
MSDVEREFNELLDAETYVDMDRLRDLARHGIPDSLRGHVWKYLLNVASPDKTQEVTKLKHLKMSYLNRNVVDAANKSLLMTIKSHLNQNKKTILYHLSLRGSINEDEEERRNKMIQIEHVLLAFMIHYTEIQFPRLQQQGIQQNMQQIFDVGLIDLLCPFVYALNGVEHDIYYCFQAFMNQIMTRFPIGIELNESVGKLMTLFRCTQLDLYLYFEQEEVEPNDWATPWIRYMLSRELPLNYVCRLYDQYFATNDFDLHYYVCLALLQEFQEELMELDYSEIRVFLRFLPTENLDMEKIIKHAYNIRAYVSTRDLF